jgi:hypothetical protein
MGKLDDIAVQIFETEFYDELSGTPASIQIRKDQISAWLETNIGHLNVLLNQSFRVDSSNDVCPVLNEEEVAIFIQLYLVYYYRREAQSVLKKLTTTVISSTPVITNSMSDWTELREGDSSIKRVASNASAQQKVQTSQLYKSFSFDAAERMNQLVHRYNMYKSQPRQVSGRDALATNCSPHPTPTP